MQHIYTMNCISCRSLWIKNVKKQPTLFQQLICSVLELQKFLYLSMSDQWPEIAGYKPDFYSSPLPDDL